MVVVVVVLGRKKRRGVRVYYRNRFVGARQVGNDGNDSKLQVSASASAKCKKCKQQGELPSTREKRRRPQVLIGAGGGTGYGGDLVCCRFDNDGMQCPGRLAQLGKPPGARHHRRGHR